MKPFIESASQEAKRRRKLSKEEIESAAIFNAMAESAAAVKASPVYDFSCVTPLLPEVGN